jgi:hypothetical protein
VKETGTATAVELTEIHGRLDQVITSIDVVKEKQEEMGEHIVSIKDSVYNPDLGLYARLRELENWKETSSRLIWIIISSIAALTVATLYKMLLSA